MSVLAEDEMRAQLRRQNIPARLIERAIAMAKARGDVAGAAGIETLAEADDARDEKSIVSGVDKQMRALGFRVINTSQPRHAKYITPGVPDRFYFHRARRIGVAWEAKTSTGVQSPAQKDFQDDMDACGWPYVLGGALALFDWLMAHHPVAYDESGNLIWVDGRRELTITPLAVPR